MLLVFDNGKYKYGIGYIGKKFDPELSIVSKD